MDSFAESQMGRESVGASPPPTSRRTARRSKEGTSQAPSATEVTVEAYPMDQQPEGLLPQSTAVDPPTMTLEDSELIAARWNRKQAAFMPVGDPYGEPDTSVPYSKRLMQEYCTPRSFGVGMKSVATYAFPSLLWIPKINKTTFKADLIAGLTVGVMLIPQSMSYANIAGLEYKYGLYTSVLPIITYALMGSSRQLGVGPVAMISLLLYTGLDGILTEEECPEYFAQANMTDPDTGLQLLEENWVDQNVLCPDAYAQLAFLTSLYVGIFQAALGLVRLGFLVSFLAHPVISGFTSAAAIIIGLSQMQYFFGFKIPKGNVHVTLIYICEHLYKTDLAQLGFGLAWWFLLWASRKLATHPKTKKRFGFLRPAAPAISCILAILVAGNLQMFNGCGFQPCNASLPLDLVVGDIPAGPSGVLSMGSIHLIDLKNSDRVFFTALWCSIIGFMESIAIAKSLAAKHKYEIDPNQELFSLGIANFLGSFTSSYPVTGSFSRSAVNNQTGAQTQLAGLITGTLILLTLLLLTEVFKFLPKFALAAIVIASVTNLVDYKEAIHLWHVKKQDCLIWFVAFFCTLFLGVLWGLAFAIGLSILLVIIETVRPQMAVLWRLPDTPIYRSIKQENAGVFVPGVIILRIGASMYFANVAFIRDYITKMLKEFSAAADFSSTSSALEMRKVNAEHGSLVPPEPIRYIVIEMTPVTSIDSTALHMLEDMHRDLKERGIRLAFSTLSSHVEETFYLSGLIDKIGEQWVHKSVHSAVQQCIRHRMTQEEEEEDSAEAKNGNGASGSLAPAASAQSGVGRQLTPDTVINSSNRDDKV